MKNLFRLIKIDECKTDNSHYYYIAKRKWFLGKWELIKVFCNKEAAKYYLENQL